MNRVLKNLLLFSSLFLLFTTSVLAQQPKEQTISINVPKSVVQQTIRDLLPLDIDTDSDSFTGTVTIAEVRNLEFADNLISCQLHLLGKDMNIITQIGGTAIKFRIGEMELDFSTDITTRFDKKKKKLMLKPHIHQIAKSSDQADGNIGKTVIALFNDKEFAVDLNTIKPITTTSGDKTITIKIDPIDATVHEQGIKIDLIPQVSAQ